MILRVELIMRGLWLETGSIEQTKALECQRLKGDYESQSARPSESSEVSSQLTESNLCTIPWTTSLSVHIS